MTAESAYTPPPEAAGGWRYLATDAEVRELAGMDPHQLDLLEREHQLLVAGHSYGIVILRHGHLVRECYSFNVSTATRFDAWSCTKSFTSTAWGVALADSELGLDTPIYELIPEGQPLTDPRKAQITVGQVLTMTGGIAGEHSSTYGCPTRTGEGAFEYALGRVTNRYGISTAELSADPGTRWEYSDPGYTHLTIAFRHAFGVEMRDFLGERVLGPIGMHEASWGEQGGAGCIGPHTNAHTGMVVSARELARFGYLMLHRGRWGDQQLVPEDWVERATRTSQDHNPYYGYGWVVNTPGSRWPFLPPDAFAADGYRSNRCYVVPSLDLVVARTGSGPGLWDEAFLMERVAGAISDA